MPAFPGAGIVPGAVFTAAYHVVWALAGLLAPLPAGLAVPAAIMLATLAVRALLLPLSVRALRRAQARARIAPRAEELRRRHAGRPRRLHADLTALRRAEGAGAFAGILPALAQWPVLSVLYLLFEAPEVAGGPNQLLTHGLLGVGLGSHWLAGAGPLSAHGAVFACLFLLIAGIGLLSARVARRAVAGPGSPPPILARLLPCLPAVVATFAPLAAGLCLATAAGWALAERALLLRPPPLGPGPGRAPGAPPPHRASPAPHRASPARQRAGPVSALGRTGRARPAAAARISAGRPRRSGRR